MKWSNEQVRILRCSICGIDAHNMLQNLSNHFSAVTALLDDSELPVRVQGALALTEMVTVHESGTLMLHVHLLLSPDNRIVKKAVSPQVGKVIQSTWHKRYRRTYEY